MIAILSKLRVAQRLILLGVIPLLALVAIVVSSTMTFSTIHSGIDEMYLERVLPLRDLKLISDDYAILVIDAVNKANAGMIDARDAQNTIEFAQQEVEKKWQAFLRSHQESEPEKQLAQEASALMQTADQSIQNVLNILSSRSGSVSGQLTAYVEPLYNQVEPVTAKLSELIDHQLAAAEHLRVELNAYADDTAKADMIIASIVVLLLALLSWFTIQSIVNPLMNMRAVMRKVEQDSDLTLRCDTGGRDEFAQTSQAFNQMLERFQQSLESISSTSEKLSVASQQVAGVSDDVASNTQKQQLETEQVATAMHEMTATVQEIAQNTLETQGAAQNANDLGKRGYETADKNTVLISDLVQDIDQTSDIINKLENESQNIGSVVEVINSIAEQTNLLALNAAIEAARAGEQGRGFAVVADEVRSLAQRTQQSTMEIKEVVERLQEGAIKAKSSMQNGQGKAEQCGHQVREGGASLKEIEDAITQIHSMNTQIATSAEEQTAVAEEISVSISAINDGAQSNSEQTQTLTQSSEHLKALALELETEAKRFRL